MTLFKKTLALAACCLPLWTATAGPLDDENARLRAQVEQLKAQLQAAQTSCSASVSPAAAASPVAPANTKPSLSAAPAAPAVPLPAPVASTATAPAAPKSDAPTTDVPTGYKLVKIEPLIPADTRWKDVNAWEALSRGMSKKDVEDLLGVEHSVTDGNGRTFWGYGKIGVQYSGKVIFVDDRLAIWTKPDF